MSLTKYASFAVLAVESATGVDLKAPAASLAKAGHRHEFEYDRRPGYIYVRSRAISSRTNDNFDQFPAEEIKQAYRTFVGKPVFVNHANADHRRARGVIIDAALHEDVNPDGTPDTWVEVLMEVDALRFPRLAEAVIKGDIARTSMGTDVAYSVCTACGNRAETPAEYCRHIPAMKGMKIRRVNASTGAPEEVLIAEVCYGLGFFENSLLVEDPADPTAYVLGVEGEGLQAAASIDSGHAVDPVIILREQQGLHSFECPHCGEVGRGLRDAESAKDRAWTHALVCYDLDWDDQVIYKTGGKDTRVPPSEHGDPRMQDKGVSVSRTDKGQYYVHTHRARSKYYDSVADIPQKDIDFIRSTGSLTKKADEDQCPYDASDSMPIGGGHYACEEGDIWHPDDAAAQAYHSESSPTHGQIQPRTSASWGEFLDLLKGGRDPRNQCMSCGAGFQWSEALHQFVCPRGHMDRPAYASKQHVGYGEVKAPSQVDTLRVDRCPVCHDDESFDGERCAVCGHVEPPAGFGDPDLDKAKQMDLRQDQVQDQVAQDPAAVDGGVPPEQGGGELQCTNCGETFSGEGQPETGPDEPAVPGDEDETGAQSAEAPEDADPEEDDDAEEPDDLSDLADLDDEDLDEALEEDDDEEDENPFAEDPAEDAGGVDEESDEDVPVAANMTCPVCGVGTLIPLAAGPQQQKVEPAVVNPDEAAAQIKAHLERILV